MRKLVRRCLAGSTAVLLSATALSIFSGPVHSEPAAPLCGWQQQFSANANNIAYPDAAANYWVSVVPIPAGGSVELQGAYPHARYMSLTSYTLAAQSIDGLVDTNIMPDEGSANPFETGANRSATDRNFTLSVVDAAVPASGRAPNTVYTSSADHSRTSPPHSVILLWRVYAPDAGLDNAGGVPLPGLTVVSDAGNRTELDTCAAATPTQVTPGPSPQGRLPADYSPRPAGAVGTDPPTWHRFTSTAGAVATNITDNELMQQTLYPLAQDLTASSPAGGFFDNPDNKYVYTSMDSELGNVLVLKGKAPTTPQTLAGEPTMGTGQLRYWSVCTESPSTTAFLGCAHDEQIPVDANGDYTVVISAASRRPHNATLDCGVTWLPAGSAQQTLLLLRHMLPSPGFTGSVQNAQPGDEAATMGEYLPTSTYFDTTESYEATGCAGA